LRKGNLTIFYLAARYAISVPKTRLLNIKFFATRPGSPSPFVGTLAKTMRLILLRVRR
jgi:hypothetical protein